MLMVRIVATQLSNWLSVDRRDSDNQSRHISIELIVHILSVRR
jgi:hypothetical protein